MFSLNQVEQEIVNCQDRLYQGYPRYGLYEIAGKLLLMITILLFQIAKRIIYDRRI